MATRTSFGLARFTPNGQLDQGFGDRGLAIMDLDLPDYETPYLTCISQARDNKMVLGGYTGGKFLVARCNADGSLDRTFGTAGQTVTDFAAIWREFGQSITIDLSNNVYLAGDGWLGQSNAIVLARYTPNGQLDPSFGSEGMVTTISAASQSVGAHAMTLDSTNRPVVAGFDRTASLDSNMLLARYNDDGTPDGTFGNEGIVLTDFFGSPNESVEAIRVDNNRRLVVGGAAYAGPLGRSSVFALARYAADGSRDRSFGVDGRVLTDIPEMYNERVQSLSLASGNRPVVSGGGLDGKTVVARYAESGSLDDTFGSQGVVTNAFPSVSSTIGQAVGVDIRDRVVVSSAGNPSQQPVNWPFNYRYPDQLAVGRLTATGQPDGAFGTDGTTVVELDQWNLLSGWDTEIGPWHATDELLVGFTAIRNF